MTGATTRRSGNTASHVPFVVLALFAGATLLYLGRSMTFWQDEWGSITFSGSWIDFLRPVNEHWSTFPLLLFRSTFAIFELHSYLPYIAEVVVLHLFAVAAAYVLVRRRAGGIVATAITVPLLFLGAGSENLFWAFQTGFVGSVMFGLWAIVFIERSGRFAPTIASLLLLASLMSSGIGLFFLVVALGRALFDPPLRRRALSVIPPTAACLVWYFLVGQEPVSKPGELAGLGAVPGFAYRGIGHSTGAVTGLDSLPHGDVIAVAVFAWIVIAASSALTATHRPALAAGCLVGIVAMYTLIGLVRAHLETDFATRSRYTYVAAFLLILAVTDWLPTLRAGLSSRPRSQVAVAGVLLVAFVAATAVNVNSLIDTRKTWQDNADLTRAYIALALARGDESWVDPNGVLLEMPPVPRLVATVERYGSPLRDTLVPSVATAPRASAQERALLGMVGRGFRVEAAMHGGTPALITVAATEDLVATPDGDCIGLTDTGPKTSVTVSGPGGIRIRVTSPSAVRGSAVLGHDQPPSRPIDLNLIPGLPVDIVIPDTGDGRIWQLRLEMPGAVGRVDICASRG